MVVPGDSDLELCRAHIERLRQVRGGARACPQGPPPAQVLVASSPGLCLSCQEPEGAGAKSPMCQKLSPKWCFLDGEWPPKGWGLPPPLAVLAGGGRRPRPGQGATFLSQPSPHSHHCQPLLQNRQGPGTHSRSALETAGSGPRGTCPAWPPCTAGYTHVRRWAVHRDGADGRELGSRGWVVGEPQSTGVFQPDTEGKALWVRGRAPGKGLAVGRGCKLVGPLCKVRGSRAGGERRGLGVGWGLAGPRPGCPVSAPPHSCSFSRSAGLASLCTPHRPPCRALTLSPTFPPQPRRNTSTT